MAAIRERFAQELRTYAAELPAWLAAGRNGQWVAILRSQFVGPFTAYADAWAAGLQTFAHPGFLVQRIQAEERPVLFSHVRWRDRGVP